MPEPEETEKLREIALRLIRQDGYQFMDGHKNHEGLERDAKLLASAWLIQNRTKNESRLASDV